MAQHNSPFMSDRSLPEITTGAAPRRLAPAVMTGVGIFLVVIAYLVLSLPAPSSGSTELVDLPALLRRDAGALLVGTIGIVLAVGGRITARIDAWGRRQAHH